jgi:putative SOS response-associated peptidase YedK
MCGRFTLTTPMPVLAEFFLFPEAAPQPPRYNIAPTQAVVAVRAAADSGKRELCLFRWGLVPSWADDPAIGNRLINARAETVADKPSFRSAFRQRRCLIPADGYYEWQKRAASKQPFYFRMRDSKPFAFAGLWEHWEPATSGPSPRGGEGVIESCTILTTAANDLLRPVHERMPVILAPEDYAQWLDPAVRQPELLQPLLRSFPAEAMTSYPVGLVVNNPRNESPQCVEPAA